MCTAQNEQKKRREPQDELIAKLSLIPHDKEWLQPRYLRGVEKQDGLHPGPG